LKTLEYFSLIFKSESNGVLSFSAGCQYIVSKKNIVNRPKKFYEKLYDMVIKSKIIETKQAHYGDYNFDCNEISVWCLERLLLYVFTDTIELSDTIKELF